jgi:hypothetical protein
MTDAWQYDKCGRHFTSIKNRKVITEQDKINKQTPFNPKQQFYPADLFILKGFDFKDQPVWERNPCWHTEDGFYIGESS